MSVNKTQDGNNGQTGVETRTLSCGPETHKAERRCMCKNDSRKHDFIAMARYHKIVTVALISV